MSHQDEEEEETGNLAIRLSNAVILPMVLKSAIELNIIDIIYTSTRSGGEWLSSLDLAARIPAKNPNAHVLLDRMLRLLASYDILKCSLSTKEDGEIERVYAAGPICRFLLTKNLEGEGSAGPLLLLNHDEIFSRSWYRLNEAVLEGGIPFKEAYGKRPNEYAKTDERFTMVFNQAMSSHTTLIMNKIVDVYKGFEGLKLLVDVGGGTGYTLKIITSNYTHIKGINFDLPHVLANAPSHPGVEHVGGDMFESVPKGDAIFMKWMLHGYDDEHCLKILKKCWEALPSNGKVIVVESILPEAPENIVSSHIVFQQDVLMLTLSPGGKERTQKDFDALAKKSGFCGCEVICSAYNSWVMEFRKKST